MTRCSPLALTLLVVAALGVGGCKGKGDGPADTDATDTDGSLPPGMAATPRGEITVGAAVVDMTPAIPETFTDLNGNHDFDGCLDTPDGDSDACAEPFDDADGDGTFDAVFIGGYGYLRPANGVRDPITARAWVVQEGGRYQAFVSLDLVGLAHPRIDDAKELLAAKGYDPERVLVVSTHNHQGPDTMGLWGDPLKGVPGFSEAYQQRVAESIVQAVEEAVAALQPATLTIGRVAMRDRGAWANGAAFGGINPQRKMHGLVNDIRDPVVVSDQVLALQAKDGDGDVIVTFTTWSGHPEVRGSSNNDLSADWVGAARAWIEQEAGGIAIHAPDCLGGMQSALGGDVPLVDATTGAMIQHTCTQDDVDEASTGCEGRQAGDLAALQDGTMVPDWAPRDSWDFVTSHGILIAQAALDALAAGEQTEAWPLAVGTAVGWVPVRNVAYNLLGPQGIFDIGLEDTTTDTSLCPRAGETQLGCLPFTVQRLRLGKLGIATAPGELLPELAWGMPTDDPLWVAEAADPTKRGPDSRYFPQHPRSCDTVAWTDCQSVEGDKDGCPCLKLHASPYRISDVDGARPILEDLDAPYKTAMSMAHTYLSYIVPEPDAHRTVSLLSDNDGDHYEDTVTPAWDFGDAFLDAWRRASEDFEARQGE